MLPKARQDKLLIQEVGDELVVYDQQRHHAHRLNRTAALVWRHCDGQMSVADITTLLQSELSLPAANEEMVWLALDRLEKSHLLCERMTRPTNAAFISRRQAIGQLGLAGGLAFLLPVVMSIVAPTPAMAASPCSSSGSVAPCPSPKPCPRVDPVTGIGMGPTSPAGIMDAMAKALEMCQKACKHCKGELTGSSAKKCDTKPDSQTGMFTCTYKSPCTCT